MKKIYLLLVVVLATASKAKSQTTISAVLTGTFIEGVSPVLNNFTFDDGNGSSVYTGGVVFHAVNNSSVVVLTFTDTTPTGTSYQWNNFDMGMTQLDSGSVIKVYDANDLTSAIGNYTLDVLPKPDWLKNGGSVSVTAITGSTIAMNASMPIQNLIQNVNPDAKLIGDKQFGLRKNEVDFKIDYDISSAIGTITNPSLVYSFEILGQETPSISIIPSSSNFTISPSLSPTFDLIFNAVYQKTEKLFEYRTPRTSFPIGAGLSIGISAGLKLDGGVKLSAVYGQNTSTGHYGFIFANNDTSQIGIAAKLDANIRGDITLLFSWLASAQGNLDLIGRLGLNYNFATQPSYNSLQFGGDLKLDGSIEFFGLASPIAKQFFGTDKYEGQIWPSAGYTYPIGSGFPNGLNSLGFRPLNGTTNTYQAKWQKELPTFNPQPAMSSRNAGLKTVWLEEDTLTGTSTLLMSKIDSGKCGFRNSLIVAENNFSMSSPKIASFANGDAIITWVQNKYNATNLPSSLTQFFNSQDIWYAIYNNASDTIIYSTSISDPANSNADGQPDVTTGIGTTAIISFLRQDQNANTTDVYYLGLDKTGGTWTITNPSGNPEKIADLQGANYNASISFADATHAVAVWINDTDNSDSTSNNKIVSYLFDVTNPLTWIYKGDIVASQNGYGYNEVALNFNGAFGALAYTYNQTIDTGLVSNNISAKIYDNTNDVWLSTNDYFDSDTLKEFYKPSISISNNGIATLVYQTKNVYTDTIPDQGELNLKIKNLNNLSSNWTTISSDSLKFVCDTNTFVWSLDVGFGQNDVLYIMTQEQDTLVGNNYLPTNGKNFGASELNQVLRTVVIDPNTLAISNAPDPCSVPLGIKENVNQNQELLISNYPNPATDYTIFDYTIKNTEFVKIEIYDLSGNLLSLPINQKLEIGRYKTWYNTDALSNGVYIYKITIGNYSVSKKLIIVK